MVSHQFVRFGRHRHCSRGDMFVVDIGEIPLLTHTKIQGVDTIIC